MRPKKCRKVCLCHLPESFKPTGCRCHSEVKLHRDEAETIRLIDVEGLNQEETAKKMEVSRITIQRIYKSARQKIADAIINGKIITLERGD